MSNLNSIVSSSPMTQKGGRGNNHKMSCKCPLCKRGGRGHNHKMGCKCPLCKRGGADPLPGDYDANLNDMEMGSSQNFANSNDYDELDDVESGNSMGKGPGEYKAGGSRRRKRRTGKKSRKGGKRSTHRRRKSRKGGRKTRRHRK